jgi:hypothetical protein
MAGMFLNICPRFAGIMYAFGGNFPTAEGTRNEGRRRIYIERKVQATSNGEATNQFTSGFNSYPERLFFYEMH